MKWKLVGSALVIEGLALHPGTFTGIDGHTITYPKDLFEEPGRITFVSRLIKLGHGDLDENVVGFITGFDIDETGLYIRGYVFDEEAKTLIQKGKMKNLSIEAIVDVDDNFVARSIKISAVSIVKNPAVENAGIRYRREKALLEKKQEEVKNKEQVEVQNQDTLLRWIREILEKAGIDKETIDLVLKALSGEYGYPYPYPYPKPEVQMEDVKAKLKELENAKKELEAKLETIEKEREELNQKLVELENERENLKKEVELQKEIATLYSKDPDANLSEIFVEDDDIDTKIYKIRQYVTSLEKSEEEVAPEPVDELKTRVMKVAKELFGHETAKEVLKILGVE